MPSLRKFAGAVGQASLLASASGQVMAARHRNRRDRRMKLAGPRASIEVLIDRWGVPHIYAADLADLFFAQGFLHARDRLWQMEFQRRAALGELAELLGPGMVGSDRLVRIFGLGRAARAEADALTGDAAEAVHAYVSGVNSYLRSRRRLPVEYRLLKARPREWQAADVTACGKLMALALSGNWAAELLRAKVVAVAGEAVAVRYGLISSQDAELAREVRPLVLGEFTMPVAPDLIRDAADLAEGSNAWVVSGARTKHGAPILACDPHLKLQIPALWYENHLTGGGFAVTGASLPGAPGVVIGHNENIAWGVTNARVDVQDLRLERLSANGTHYLHEGSWHPVDVALEEIAVRGQEAPVVETVRLTRNGPLVTSMLADEVPPADSSGGTIGWALRWVAHDPSAIVPAVMALNRAASWDDFRAALAAWTCPAQNFVYADTQGNIGYLLGGTVPVRSKGSGRLPTPGWTRQYDWAGTLPAELMPNLLNPAQGYVVSANDGVQGAGTVEVDGEWLAGYRARRITQLIVEQPRHDVDSFARLQADLLSLPGLELAAVADRLPATDDCERQARLALAEWDGMLSAGSVAGSIYCSLRAELMKSAFTEIAEPLGLQAGLGAYAWQPGLEFLEQDAVERVLGMLADDADGWLPAGRTWDDVLTTAWRTTLAELRDGWGPDVSQWAYGRTHELALQHAFGGLPLLGRLLNRGPFPMGGDVDTVCPGHLIRRGDGNAAFAGASYRQICDLADWDNSRSILTPGQSGRPGDIHYADFVDPWLNDRHHPMLWRRGRVEQETEQRITMVPESRTDRPGVRQR